MPSFIIQTDPAEADRHGPNTMFWTADGVRGPIDANRTATRYDDQVAADAAFAEIPERIRRFYGLAVVPEPYWMRPGYHPPLSGNGWMVGHPGYDLH